MLFLGVVPRLACAEAIGPPPPAADPPGWLGAVEGGFIHSRDSADGSSQTTSAKAALTHTGPYWINIFSGEAVSVSNNLPGAPHPERYLASYRARHFWDSRDYFAFRNQWEKDRFSGIRYQAFSSLNSGRKFAASEHADIKLELGVGVRETERLGADATSEIIGLCSWELAYDFNRDSRVSQKGGIEYGDLDRIFRLDTQFRQYVTRVVALTLNHDVKRVDGEGRSDENVTSFGVSYQFK